ncbi:MAG: hypothetical protein HKUEN01_22810 [Candidatus Kuenenia stuttgartiensis]|nr:MAG: hypothetical protein HKUEN01_22810 [Candidatus Kuenenia stuttgartiensis]
MPVQPETFKFVKTRNIMRFNRETRNTKEEPQISQIAQIKKRKRNHRFHRLRRERSRTIAQIKKSSQAYNCLFFHR